MSDTNLDWRGETLAYKRKSGFGLILRKYHYRFAGNGSIEEISPVTRPVLELLVKALYPNNWQITLVAGLGKKDKGKKDE